MSPQRGLFQAMCGDDGQDDNDDDNGDHDDADDDDDTLSPLVSPPDRASFELPRAPDIGSCNANLLSNEGHWTKTSKKKYFNICGLTCWGLRCWRLPLTLD